MSDEITDEMLKMISLQQQQIDGLQKQLVNQQEQLRLLENVCTAPKPNNKKEI